MADGTGGTSAAAGPTPEPAPGPSRSVDEAPRALTWVTRSVLAMVVVGAATAVLVVVQREELLAAWTVGHPPDSTIKPLAFVPVALVLFVVFVGSVLLMLAFLLGGHGWARYCLAAIVAFVALATVAALRTNPPAAFVLVSAIGLGVEVSTLALLWHPATSAFLRGLPPPGTDRQAHPGG